MTPRPAAGGCMSLADREVEQSGMRWTILRPHFFMQNLLGAAHGIAADRAFSLNMGEGRLGMIDVRDVAELAAQVLTEEPDRHHGKIYTPTGPQSISFAEGAEQLRQILGREVRYVPVADEAARTNLLETGMPEWIVELQVEYGQAYASGWGDFTTSDFQDVVGRRPRSFADFARDYAGVFTPAEAVSGAAER